MGVGKVLLLVSAVEIAYLWHSNTQVTMGVGKVLLLVSAVGIAYLWHSITQGTMGVGKVLLLVSALGIAYLWHSITEVPPLPKLERTWWGEGKPTKQDESIRPFKISISDEVLDDLSKRLEFHGSLTPPMEGTNFRYGFNTDYLKKVVAFWRTEYKWRDRETFLNSVPHFKTHISGLDLHYIHVKPKQVPTGTRVIPLMLLHGWPGSIREFYSLIPLLTTPQKNVDFVFEVVVPSLPGYGFSQGASKPGLGAAEMAVVMHNLMERVGHTKYYLQGGDLGAIIGAHIGILYPDNILGFHSNMCLSNSILSNLKTLLGSFFPSLVVDKEHEHLMYPFAPKLQWLLLETGYFHIQATKPDTVGVALSDSPVGLAAYILEKVSTGTNPEWINLPDGGLTKKFTLTDILDNVMIYWVTGSITTSMRLYSETFNKRQQSLGLNTIPVQVPTACAQFPHEMAYQSEFVLKDKYPNMVKFTNMPRGGHFAALEEPGLMSFDIWETVTLIENQNKNAKSNINSR